MSRLKARPVKLHIPSTTASKAGDYAWRTLRGDPERRKIAAGEFAERGFGPL